MSETKPEANVVSGIDTRKDHRFLTDLYREIEARFDVNALLYEGVHVWPLVRLQLGRSFKETDPIADAGSVNPSPAPASTPSAETGPPLPRNKANRARLLKEHAKAARKNPDASRARVAEDWARLEEVAGPRFVVQTKIEKYYLQKGERFYAPILDPVSEDLEQHGRVQRLAIEPLPIPCVNDPLRVNADAYLAVNSWPDFSPSPELDEGLAEIEAFVREAWPDFPLDRQRIYARLDRLRRRRDFYVEVYRRLQPEFLVLSSFTGWQHALWAAKDLGIPVIDVQHGGQGETHFPTTHFANLPETGYHFLPDVLWLWGSINHEFARRWLPGAARHRHLPVVGGHRGVARWEKDRLAGHLAPRDREFIERFSARPNVLVTLSYAIDPLMPHEVFEAIAKTPDVHWLIRLHPIHRPQAARDQIVAKLEAMGLTNVSLDEPTNVQMQTALFVSRAHITPFSTSVREALAFGVPSAIIHPVGEPLFKEEIETGLLDFAVEIDEIVAFVRRNLHEAAVTAGISRQAIEVADSAVRDVVRAAEDVKNNALPLRSTLPTQTPDDVRRHGETEKLEAPGRGMIKRLFRMIR